MPKRGMSSNLPTKTEGKKPDKSDFFKSGPAQETFLHPSLTPRPRSPKTPADFRYPERIGHWHSFGFDWSNPFADRYYLHEAIGGVVFLIVAGSIIKMYSPDYKLEDWAHREAFLRTHKREALGLPLIEVNFVDPERIVLPSEDELGDFDVHL